MDPELSSKEELKLVKDETTVSVGYIPVLIPKNKEFRKIEGKVYCGEGLARSIVRNAQIELFKSNQVLKTTNSDSAGNYFFLTEALPGEVYLIKATSKCGKASQTVEMTKDTKLDITLN